MTKLQIEKLLKKNGIDLTHLEISRDEVVVFIDNGLGHADMEKQEALEEQIGKVLGWGGSRAGYGGFHFYNNYKIDQYEGFCTQKDSLPKAFSPIDGLHDSIREGLQESYANANYKAKMD